MWGANIAAYGIPPGLNGWLQLHLWLLIGAAGLAWLTVQLGEEIRNPDAAILSLWIAGTVVFNVFINWSINARYLLPMLPAVGLAIGRVMSRKPCPRLGFGWAATSYALSLTLALVVARADYRMANATKSAVEQIARTYVATSDTNWFQGHWGGQYYFEKNGWRAIHYGATLYPGAYVASPSIGCNRILMDRCPHQDIASTTTDLGSVQTVESGAGFYSSQLGILPFSISEACLRYTIAVVLPPPDEQPQHK